jgi:hypothetical protein
VTDDVQDRRFVVDDEKGGTPSCGDCGRRVLRRIGRDHGSRVHNVVYRMNRARRVAFTRVNV